MAKRNSRRQSSSGSESIIPKLFGLISWITGILVSLAVGFGMVEKVLTVMYIPEIITVIAGWIVVIVTILSVILVLLGKL